MDQQRRKSGDVAACFSGFLLLAFASRNFGTMFGCDRIAFGPFDQGPFSASSWNTTLPGGMSRGANFAQEQEHAATNLTRSQRGVATLPLIERRGGIFSSQHQLIKSQQHHLTPEFKLLGRAHLKRAPEQILFTKAIAMLVAEAASVALPD